MKKLLEEIDNISTLDEFAELFISNIRNNLIFCPVCGEIKSVDKKFLELYQEMNVFCEGCNQRLNDFWEGYQKKIIGSTICISCKQRTFDDQNFCFICGWDQRELKVKMKKPKSNIFIGRQIFGILFGLLSILSISLIFKFYYAFIYSVSLFGISILLSILSLALTWPSRRKGAKRTTLIGFGISVFAAVIDATIILIIYLVLNAIPFIIPIGILK